MRVWNRSREKAEPLALEGAVVAETPAEAVAGEDVILTFSADGNAVEGVMARQEAAAAPRAARSGSGRALLARMARSGLRGWPRSTNSSSSTPRSLGSSEAGAGTRLKLVVNTWLIALVEGAAEAITLAKAVGLDPKEFLQAVKGASIDTPYLQLKGTAMIERRFGPTFKLALAEEGRAADPGGNA